MSLYLKGVKRGELKETDLSILETYGFKWCSKDCRFESKKKTAPPTLNSFASTIGIEVVQYGCTGKK